MAHIYSESVHVYSIQYLSLTGEKWKTEFFQWLCSTAGQTLSKYSSVAHVQIIVIWHLSSLARLSSFLKRKVLKASCKLGTILKGTELMTFNNTMTSFFWNK